MMDQDPPLEDRNILFLIKCLELTWYPKGIYPWNNLLVSAEMMSCILMSHRRGKKQQSQAIHLPEMKAGSIHCGLGNAL
jgi:hypothetical protein